jgi:hypothetical protein
MNSTLISQINFNLTLSTSIIFSVFGLIGNSLSVFIIIKKQFRRVSFFRYLAFSIINDTIVLITMWLYTIPDYFQTSSIGCKLTQYFGFLFYQFCPWIEVVSSIDRVISVKYPTKYKFRTKLKYQILISSILFAIMVFLNIPLYWYYDIEVQQDKTICTINNVQTQFYVDLASFLVTVIIPFIIMITCTSIIGHIMIKRKIGSLQNRSNIKKEIQLIKVMCALNVFFLLTNLPYCIQQLVFVSLSFQNIFIDYQSIILSLTSAFVYLQNSCSLILCIIFNKVFRKCFFSMISFKQNRVHPQNNLKQINLLLKNLNTRHPRECFV